MIKIYKIFFLLSLSINFNNLIGQEEKQINPILMVFLDQGYENIVNYLYTSNTTIPMITLAFAQALKSDANNLIIYASESVMKSLIMRHSISEDFNFTQHDIELPNFIKLYQRYGNTHIFNTIEDIKDFYKKTTQPSQEINNNKIIPNFYHEYCYNALDLDKWAVGRTINNSYILIPRKNISTDSSQWINYKNLNGFNGTKIDPFIDFSYPVLEEALTNTEADTESSLINLSKILNQDNNMPITINLTGYTLTLTKKQIASLNTSLNKKENETNLKSKKVSLVSEILFYKKQSAWYKELQKIVKKQNKPDLMTIAGINTKFINLIFNNRAYSINNNPIKITNNLP